MGVTIKMALLLGQGSAASFHYGFSKHIYTWLGGLFFQNGHSLFTCVLKKYKTTTSNSIDFIPQLHYKVLKPGHLQTADGEEVKQKLLEYELKILSKETKNSDRHDLESKLETLEAFGCTMDQIQESPEILQLSLTEIVKRAFILKKLNHENISVQLLKVIRSNMSSFQLKQKIKSLQPLTNYSTMTDYMREVLQCSHAEMYTIMQKVPAIKSFRNMVAFTEKVEYLRSQGLTTDDFKNYPAILCRSLLILEERSRIIKKFQEDNNFPVASLIISDKQFQRFLVKYRADQNTLKGHNNRNECIAKMFGVSAMIESQMHYFDKRRLATVKPRIDYLMSVGIPLEHIRNHPYILRYRIVTLQNAFIKSQEAGIQNISILHLIHIIICGRVPLKPPVPKSTNYLPELLGLPLNKMKKKYEHLRPLVTRNRFCLKENLDFLLSEGFTLPQVCTCPLILSHTLEELKTSLKMLPLQPEMQNNLDMLQNGTMKINLMQYFLEKESNFRLAPVEIL